MPFHYRPSRGYGSLKYRWPNLFCSAYQLRGKSAPAPFAPCLLSASPEGQQRRHTDAQEKGLCGSLLVLTSCPSPNFSLLYHVRFSQVEFFLPQLCIVVALGGFEHPAPLVEYLLELCETDLRIAHKTHWFLKSFCTGSESVGSAAMILFRFFYFLGDAASYSVRGSRRPCFALCLRMRNCHFVMARVLKRDSPY